MDRVLLTLRIGGNLFIDVAAFHQFSSNAVVGKRSPEEGDECDPVADRLHAIVGDSNSFLVCDLELKHYRTHRCDSSDGVARVFDPHRQHCVAAAAARQWLLMTVPKPVPWKKVGDVCVVNRDCIDGMYCTGAACSCYMNYAEVNSRCVRIASVCPGSIYYPEPVNGKPKPCSVLESCPPGYVCKPEAGGDQGFCCLAAATEVCDSSDAYVINDRPVPCFDASSSSELCPDGYTCQNYPLANRRYCCGQQNNFSGVTPAPSSSLPVQPDPRAMYCPPQTVPHLHDDTPVVCNPTNELSCPNGYQCQRNEKLNLHFCCSSQSGNIATGPTNATTEQPHVTPWTNDLNGEDGNQTDKEKGPSLYPPIDACSSTHPAFIFEGKPVLCIANDSASCPIGYACTMHTPTVHFCCRMSPPDSSQPFIDSPPTIFSSPTTLQATTTASSQSSPVSSPSIENICGQSSKPYLHGGNALMCLTNETETCPSGYSCDLHAQSGSYFCCQNMASTLPVIPVSSRGADGCPEDMQAVHDGASVQICDRTLSSGTCPNGATCVYSVTNARYQCCTKEKMDPSISVTNGEKQAKKPSLDSSDECPSGLVSYHRPSSNESLLCSPNQIDQCPAGFFCQWSDASERFLCCGVSAGCPGRSVAHVNPTIGKVHYCGHSSDQPCPAGYTCQRSLNGSHICCTGDNTTSAQPRLHPVSFEKENGNEISQNVNALGSAQVHQSCPAGLPFSEHGSALSCSETVSCPPGYECLPSPAGNTCCLRAEKVCGLPSEPGTTLCMNGTTIPSPLSQYYYDAQSESCKEFPYNGCGGNLNNFESLEECEQFCSIALCPRGLPVQVSGKAQHCDGISHQCPMDYACTVPNFGPMSSGKMICCPSAALICNLDPQAGQPCRPNTATLSTVTRYHYVASLHVCRPFSYYGCSGNSNNFETAAECISFCSHVDVLDHLDSTQPSPPVTSPWTVPSDVKCPVYGQVLHSDPAFHICRPSSLFPCPDGFTCQKGAKQGVTSDIFVCCGPPTGHLKNQICPNGTDVYMNTLSAQPALCNPADGEACPNGYSCVLSKFMRTFYCCATLSPNRALIVEPPPRSLPNRMLNTGEESEPECPANRKPYLYPRTNKTLACLQPTSKCPRNYACILSNKWNMYLCCSEKTNDEAIWPSQRSNEPVMPDIYTRSMNGVQSGQSPSAPTHSRRPAAGIGEQELACDLTEKKQLGQDCCADEQCSYQCGSFQGHRLCVCPLFNYLDLSADPPLCYGLCVHACIPCDGQVSAPWRDEEAVRAHQSTPCNKQYGRILMGLNKSASTCSTWRIGAFCLPENPATYPQLTMPNQKQIQRRPRPPKLSRTFARRRVVGK